MGRRIPHPMPGDQREVANALRLVDTRAMRRNGTTIEAAGLERQTRGDRRAIARGVGDREIEDVAHYPRGVRRHDLLVVVVEVALRFVETVRRRKFPLPFLEAESV